MPLVVHKFWMATRLPGVLLCYLLLVDAVSLVLGSVPMYEPLYEPPYEPEGEEMGDPNFSNLGNSLYIECNLGKI